MSAVAKAIKILIEAGKYDLAKKQTEQLYKLKRITKADYDELMALMGQ